MTAFSAEEARDAALRRLRALLVDAGGTHAALDARCLLEAALGDQASSLIAWPEHPLGREAALRLTELARRRIAREPVGRILGHREFWGLPFRLSPGTLEPRPDSETLVETALALVPDGDAPLSILDLGTGSGCILISLLHERPHAEGVGIDRSYDALTTARWNAVANGVGGRAVFAASDWSDAVGRRFDLVVANPPYIPSGDLAGLSPEVTQYDPVAALDGGEDGLAAYRALLADLDRILAPGGHAVLEIGHDQASALAVLAPSLDLAFGHVVRDLAGLDRVVVLSRRGASALFRSAGSLG